jgi:hypothetical protein
MCPCDGFLVIDAFSFREYFSMLKFGVLLSRILPATVSLFSSIKKLID